MNVDQILKSIKSLKTADRQRFLKELSELCGVVAMDGGTPDPDEHDGTDPDSHGNCPEGYYKGDDGKCYKNPLT